MSHKQYLTYTSLLFIFFTVSYVYGLKNLLRDIAFMLDQKLGIYWKLCWGIIVPGTLTFFFIYFIATFTEITYAGMLYPSSAIFAGWMLVIVAWMQVPIGIIYCFYTSEQQTLFSKIIDMCTPTKHWGPLDQKTKQEWLMYSVNSDCSNDEEYLLINDTPKEGAKSNSNN